MLYLIGLGLNKNGISIEGLEIVKRCKRVYLENYTVDFPYSEGMLNEVIEKKIISADRKKVESLEIVDEAKKMDVALLIYGSPLTATTHISLIEEAKKSRVKCKVLYAGSILDAVAETGLQIYKFGKIASMPMWKKNFEPKSFMEIVKENKSINAHSLILVDIGLHFKTAIKQLEISAKKHNIKLMKILICQMLGTKHKKFYYKNIEEFVGAQMKKPYCLIIPSKLHFIEKEAIERFD
jgi:diphthine synthase